MRLKSKIFYGYALFVIIFSLCTLVPSPSVATLAKYHLQPSALRLLDITLLLPMYVMWFAIFYGYDKLHNYGQLIKGNHDGEQVGKLAKGLLAFAVGLPLTSILSSLLQLIARHHQGFTAASTIISNYIGVAYALIGFIYINKGTRGLGERSRTSPSFGFLNTVILIVIFLGVIFCDLIARSHHNIATTYHMSYSLVMLTFAVPCMYTWFLGLFAVAGMYAYSKHVSGIVYRKGWNRLAFGLGSIIVLDISLQYLDTLSSWLNGLSLSSVLLVLYVLLLGLAAGFIVVALGTKELIKIEKA